MYFTRSLLDQYQVITWSFTRYSTRSFTRLLLCTPSRYSDTYQVFRIGTARQVIVALTTRYYIQGRHHQQDTKTSNTIYIYPYTPSHHLYTYVPHCSNSIAVYTECYQDIIYMLAVTTYPMYSFIYVQLLSKQVTYSYEHLYLNQPSDQLRVLIKSKPIF